MPLSVVGPFRAIQPVGFVHPFCLEEFNEVLYRVVIATAQVLLR